LSETVSILKQRIEGLEHNQEQHSASVQMQADMLEKLSLHVSQELQALHAKSEQVWE